MRRSAPRHGQLALTAVLAGMLLIALLAWCGPVWRGYAAAKIDKPVASLPEMVATIRFLLTVTSATSPSERGRIICVGRILLAVLALLIATALPLPIVSAAAADPQMSAFTAAWERSDGSHSRGDQPFFWGPHPIIPLVTEQLAGTLADWRSVLYWDKGRMEIADPTVVPDRWQVESGLLVAEMVTGHPQAAAASETAAPYAPAQVPFGDLDDSVGPTFASFTARLGDAPLAVDQPVTQALDRAGRVSATDDGRIVCAEIVVAAHHCIAAPFRAFLEASSRRYEGVDQLDAGVFDHRLTMTGVPLSEAYWIVVKARGRPARVLIQLFERRTLTYNPANSVNTQVEMGNVGLEYYHWRYDALLPGAVPTRLDPALSEAENLTWNASPQYRYLIENLAEGRFQLLWQRGIEGHGITSPTYHTIRLDAGFATAPAVRRHTLAVVLAHEAQHSSDATHLGIPQNAAECAVFEMRGFLVAAAIWQDWYGAAGKPAPSDDIEREANEILLLIRADPARFAQQVTKRYQRECAERGPGSADRFLTLAGLPEGIAAVLPVQQVFASVHAGR